MLWLIVFFVKSSQNLLMVDSVLKSALFSGQIFADDKDYLLQIVSIEFGNLLDEFLM
jgi:hypothetical protein